MRLALLADVHANLPALRAVLAEVRRRGADRLLVLGDVVGYHADPNECVALLAEAGADGVAGNHDRGALGWNDAFASRSAARLQRWTAARLSPAARAFLTALPPRRDYDGAVAVHGCFTSADHVTGYVTPTTAAANLQWLAARREGPCVGLFGHTHMPAVHSDAFPGLAAPARGTVALPRRAHVLINPGSVGQPRDGDPRAAFALLDLQGGTVEFVRVAYDVDAAVRRLVEESLDAELADRLREGR